MHYFSGGAQIALVAFVFLFGSIHSNSWEPCGDWIAYNDEKCFKIIDDTLRTFDEAKDACATQQHTSTLAVIRSSGEQQFLANYLFKTAQKVENYWIGAKYSSQNGSFIWIDNAPLNYTNWDAAHSPQSRADHCVHMQAEESVAGKWKDGRCGRKNAVVCQRMQFWTIDFLQKNFLDSRKQQKYLTQGLANANQIIDTHKQNMENVNQRIDELKQSLESANSRINEQKQNLESANQRISEQKQSLESANQRINGQKQSLESANQRISEQNQNLESANQRISEQNQNLESANQRINEQKQSFKSANQRISEQNQNLESANQKINKQKQNLDSANQKINEQKQNLNSANQKINEQKQSLENANQRINKLQNNIVPVGFIYVQLPQQPEPSTLWTNVEWKDVTSTFAGLFFRAEGEGSGEFGFSQEENAPRVTKVKHEAEIKASDGYLKWDDTTLNVGGWSSGIGVFSGQWPGNPAGTTLKFLMSGGEIRPRNMAVRIWKRDN